MSYTTCLFDFDYTLADSSHAIVLCFRNVLERRQFTGVTDEAIKRTIGKTLKDSFELLTGISDEEILAALQKEYSKEADIHMNANTILYPETMPALNELKKKKIKIGIISTKYRFRIESFLKDFVPPDFFDIIIGGEDVSVHKPAPEGILSAIEQLKSRKSDTLYVGDNVIDAQTAQSAGVDFAAVLSGTTTAGEFLDFPHTIIADNLQEIIQSVDWKNDKDNFQQKKSGFVS